MLPFIPEIIPGTNRVCPRDKPGEIGLPLCKIRRKPGFVPGFHRICLMDEPGEIPGTNPQRAQRSKKFDLDRNFQPRSKFLISVENFDIDVSISPQKKGPRWVARSKISFSIEIFNLDQTRGRPKTNQKKKNYVYVPFSCLI